MVEQNETLITSLESSPFAIHLPAERVEIEMPTTFRHQKDVSITHDDKTFYMVTSVTDVDDQSDWKMRNYTAPTIYGPWKDEGYVTVEGNVSPRMCAAGVLKEESYVLAVQTECFGPGGSIEVATSTDGKIYTHRRTILESPISGTPIIGIYDSEPTIATDEKGQTQKYITFTGVNQYENGKAKDGAIYIAKVNNTWTESKIVKTMFDEHSIPPHLPTLEGGEWVPEGGKAYEVIRQTATDKEKNILFYGTCFLKGDEGNRQRGFLAVADNITGEYTFLGLVEPKNNIPGETGHGTVVIEKDTNMNDTSKDLLHIIHQARTQETGTWHLERTTYNLTEILQLGREKNLH